MTQAELAEKAKISRAIINRLETGKATETKASTLQRIADALNVTMDDIVCKK